MAGRDYGSVRISSCWIITDGKAGNEMPALGLARALGCVPEVRLIQPRKLWRALMPWGSIDPAERFDKPRSPLRPPYPELAIASGRLTFAYLRELKRLSPKTFGVFLKNPRAAAGFVDFIWAPSHDRLTGDKIMTTLTSPHHISATLLDDGRRNPMSSLARLAKPRVAVLLGGDSHKVKYRLEDAGRMAEQLEKVALNCNAHFMISPSRRTPGFLLKEFARRFHEPDHWLWDGTGVNPYINMLAHAQAIVVTVDSTNMIAEALAVGCPVYVLQPANFRPSRRIAYYLEALIERELISPLASELSFANRQVIDATPEIALAIGEAITKSRL